MADRPQWLNDWGKPIPAQWGDLHALHGRAIRAGAMDYPKLRAAGLTEYQAATLLDMARQSRFVGTAPVAPEAAPAIDSAAHYLQEHRYIYDDERDVYVTFLSCVKKPLVMPGDKHRSIVQAYSNWDGSPATLNEIARTFAFNRFDD